MRPFQGRPGEYQYGPRETGLFRKNRQEVERYARELTKEIVGSFEDETKIDESIREMFRVTGLPFGEISADERADVRNFARYAAKRLSAGAVVSPMHARFSEAGRLDIAFTDSAPLHMAKHDLMHAIAAYGQSKGKTLIPAYTRVALKDQVSDPAAVQEEIVANLFAGGTVIPEPFIHSLLNGSSVADAYRAAIPRHFGDSEATLPAFRTATEKIEPLKKESPVEYLLQMYEKYWSFALQEPFQEVPKDADFTVDGSIAYIQAHRSPLYVSIVERMYENSLKEKPDPKIMLHIFQDTVKPLLERLRKQDPKKQAA